MDLSPVQAHHRNHFPAGMNKIPGMNKIKEAAYETRN